MKYLEMAPLYVHKRPLFKSMELVLSDSGRVCMHLGTSICDTHCDFQYSHDPKFLTYFFFIWCWFLRPLARPLLSFYRISWCNMKVRYMMAWTVGNSCRNSMGYQPVQPQLSNLWWKSNSVSKVFGTSMTRDHQEAFSDTSQPFRKFQVGLPV